MDNSHDSRLARWMQVTCRALVACTAASPRRPLPEVSAGGFGGATQAAEDLKTFEARQICVNFRLKWEKWKSGWENIYENGWEHPPFLS